jgi:hypothetical protein
MAVEFNTPISLLAFAAFNKSGSPNSSAQWGNAGDGYQDPSVNWLGYVGQNASGIRYAFAYGFSTPSWQGEATQLTLRINLAEELGRNRSIRWSLTTSNPMYLGNAYAQQDLPTDSGRLDDGTLEITASTRATYTIQIDLSLITLQPNTTYYLVLSPDTTSSGTSNYCSVPNNDGAGNVYTAQDILDGAVTYEAEASGVTAPDGYFGQAMTISMTDDGLEKTLTYSCAGATGTIVTDTTAASVSWTPPASLMDRIPSDSSAQCTITCETLAGTTTCTCTLTVPESIKPVFTSGGITVVNANTTVAGWGLCLQNFSQIETTFQVSARYSRLVSWKIDGGAFSLEGSISNVRLYTGDETSPILTAAGTYNVKITVTDQRGRSTTAQVTTPYTVTPYTAPTATGFEVYRCDSTGAADSEGTYLYAIATRSYTQVGTNTCTMYFEYKERSSDTWTRHPTAMQDNTGIIVGGSLLPIRTYSTRVYVEDSLGGTYVYYGVSTVSAAFNLRPTEASGAGFGGYSQEDRVVELFNNWILRVPSDEHIVVWDGQTTKTLRQLIAAGGGSSGGTSDYDQLDNRPSINGNTLTGNKTAANLGLEATANKVTSISSSSTDDQYPSALCVYTLVGDIESALAALI